LPWEEGRDDEHEPMKQGSKCRDAIYRVHLGAH